LSWPANVWLGTSVENQDYRSRIDDLLQCPAAVHFLSLEPLLGDIDLSPYLKKLDWVIVGSETGPGARPMKIEWVRSIRNQCAAAGVPFFLKAMMANGKVVHDGMPKAVQR
jgi:protein gp37